MTDNSHKSVEELEAEGRFFEAHVEIERRKQEKIREANRLEGVLQQKYESDQKELQEMQLLEEESFEDAWNQKLQEFSDNANQLIEMTKSRQREELEEFRNEIRRKFGQRKPKFSKMVLETRLVLERLVKSKEYIKAERVRRELEKLESEDANRLRKDMQQMFRKKEAVFTQKHAQEIKVLKQRVVEGLHQLKRQKDMDHKRMLQHHTNVRQEVSNSQKKSMARTHVSLTKQTRAMQITPKKASLGLRDMASYTDLSQYSRTYGHMSGTSGAKIDSANESYKIQASELLPMEEIERRRSVVAAEREREREGEEGAEREREREVEFVAPRSQGSSKGGAFEVSFDDDFGHEVERESGEELSADEVRQKAGTFSTDPSPNRRLPASSANTAKQPTNANSSSSMNTGNRNSSNSASATRGDRNSAFSTVPSNSTAMSKAGTAANARGTVPSKNGPQTSSVGKKAVSDAPAAFAAEFGDDFAAEFEAQFDNDVGFTDDFGASTSQKSQQSQQFAFDADFDDHF